MIETAWLANIAFTIISLLEFEAPIDYEPTLIQVSNKTKTNATKNLKTDEPDQVVTLAIENPWLPAFRRTKPIMLSFLISERQN